MSKQNFIAVENTPNNREYKVEGYMDIYQIFVKVPNFNLFGKDRSYWRRANYLGTSSPYLSIEQSHTSLESAVSKIESWKKGLTTYKHPNPRKCITRLITGKILTKQSATRGLAR